MHPGGWGCGWWGTALINFVDLRIDSALKIFVYMSQPYEQRNPILFSRLRQLFRVFECSRVSSRRWPQSWALPLVGPMPYLCKIATHAAPAAVRL